MIIVVVAPSVVLATVAVDVRDAVIVPSVMASAFVVVADVITL